ncbi:MULTISPECIES: dimethylamine monooxygenase subunit DmmA family protein [Nocardioides]|uniref:Dimethylamine monooxygenase subunit DmmA family protein n=1 Tax=Nocardioides vastitatis TaxID=2568655 RepID=A0ABW0ZFQ9_9ACTN|nr:dimethylamine monooxygenase subunit DmmA family protein [Nocardioides sp.]
MTADQAARTGVVHPPALSLPVWPDTPEPVDPTGASYLVLALGGTPETARVARRWVGVAESMAATTLGVLDGIDTPADREILDRLLATARTGVRLMIVGGQYDVLLTLSAARAAGLVPAELRSFVTSTAELPVYCAHCRDTHRVEGAPGDEVTCKGCARVLQIHHHLAGALGSFLASDARASELPSDQWEPAERRPR